MKLQVKDVIAIEGEYVPSNGEPTIVVGEDEVFFCVGDGKTKYLDLEVKTRGDMVEYLKTLSPVDADIVKCSLVMAVPRTTLPNYARVLDAVIEVTSSSCCNGKSRTK
jgi:hypothetical protein